MSMLKKILIISIIFTIVFLITGWGFMNFIATRSSFCGNCHYMKPYVEQWKASVHKDVDCIRCHPTEASAMVGQLVKYMINTYNIRPRAYVPDEACKTKKCHSNMLENKSVSFFNISFPHKTHLSEERLGIKLRCASCHGASGKAGHVQVDKKVCFLCHFKGQSPSGTLTGCGSCHSAPSGQIRHGGFYFDMQKYVESGVKCDKCHLTVHQGEGKVTEDKCFICHMSQNRESYDSKVLHKKHVGGKEIRCLDCHEAIQHGNIKMLSVLDVSCESCHTNLHTGPKEMYIGVGAKGTDDTPSRMFAAQINCTGCHTNVINRGGLSFLGRGNKTADPKACAACHDSRFVPMVDRWKEYGREIIDEANLFSLTGKKILDHFPKKSNIGKHVDDLEFNARFLKEGHPVHNIEYSIKILQASERILNSMESSTENVKKSKISLGFAKDSFSYCLNSCHSFIPRKEPYIFQNITFPHTFHVKRAGLVCDLCHISNSHKNLAISKPSDCAPCHHSGAKADCKRCHNAQDALYNGKIPPEIGFSTPADSMAGIVGCSDCHDPTQPEPLKNINKSCINCHESKGESDYRDINRKLKTSLDRVHTLIDDIRLSIGMLERRKCSSKDYVDKLNKTNKRVDFIERAKAIHNPKSSLPELEKSIKELESLLEKITKANNN